MVSTTAASAASRCRCSSFSPPCSAMLSPDSLTRTRAKRNSASRAYRSPFRAINGRPTSQVRPSGQGISEGAPDHVTRNSDVVACHPNVTCADKTHSTPTKATIWRGIDDAATRCAVVAEQARILLDALVRVATILTGKAQLIDRNGLSHSTRRWRAIHSRSRTSDVPGERSVRP